MKRLAIVIVLLATFATAAPAQTVGFTVGGGRTWDDEGSIGNGRLLGGSLSWPTRGRTVFGVDVERLTHDRTTSHGGLRFRGRTWLVSGIGAWRFAIGRARPYVFGGVGLLNYEGTFEDATFQIRQPRDSDSTTFSFGTGVDISAGERFSVRPELRIYMAQPQDDFAPWSIIRGAVTIGWQR